MKLYKILDIREADYGCEECPKDGPHAILILDDGKKNVGACHQCGRICLWGSTALLTIFQLMGTEYNDIRIISRIEKADFFLYNYK